MYFQLRSHLHLKVCTSPRGACRWARPQSDMPALKMGMSIAIFFRVYNPYLGGLKPSFFTVLESKSVDFQKWSTCFVVWWFFNGFYHGKSLFCTTIWGVCCIFFNHQTSKSKSIECYLFSYDILFLSQPQVAAPLNTENKIYIIFQRVWIET